MALFTKKASTDVILRKKCKKMQKYLVMSEKCSNFARFFADRPD
jgi:hypothetical protein